MTKFKIFASLFRFILCTGVGGVIDHYLGITKLLINIIETIVGDFDIMNELLSSWILIIWLGLTIMFVSDKIGFTKWVYNCFKKAKTDAQTLIQPTKSLQSNHDLFRKYLRSILRDVKKFQNRQKQKNRYK